MNAIEKFTRKRFANTDHEASVQTECDNPLAHIKLNNEEYLMRYLSISNGRQVDFRDLLDQWNRTLPKV